MGRPRKKKKIVAREQSHREPIPCELRLISEFGALMPNKNRRQTKRGRYAGSRYSGVGADRYGVVAYLDADFSSLLDRDLTDGDVVLGCLTHLNQPPARKKYAKRAPKPLYGDLNLVRQQRRTTADGEIYFIVVMSTDQKENKNFWGTGLSG